jgi:hypothetical protein
VHARMGMACLATRERIESPILKEIATRLVHSGYTGRYRGGGVEGGALLQVLGGGVEGGAASCNRTDKQAGTDTGYDISQSHFFGILPR